MRDRIKQVMARVLKTEVNDATSQTNCAGWDSLRHLNLVVELECEFDVSFEPEEIAQMKDINAIEAMLKNK
jgi:acyl carrier protein